MTLMLSSTGLGSWAHTNLHGARASPRCPLVGSHTPSLVPAPGWRFRSLLPSSVDAQALGQTQPQHQAQDLCGSSLGDPGAAEVLRGPPLVNPCCEGRYHVQTSVSAPKEPSLVGRGGVCTGNQDMRLNGTSTLREVSEGLGKSKVERWLLGTASWRRRQGAGLDEWFMPPRNIYLGFQMPCGQDSGRVSLKETFLGLHPKVSKYKLVNLS